MATGINLFAYFQANQRFHNYFIIAKKKLNDILDDFNDKPNITSEKWNFKDSQYTEEQMGWLLKSICLHFYKPIKISQTFDGALKS